MRVRWELLYLGLVSAQYCDSTLNQRCPDGLLCTSSNADCQLGPKLCVCRVGGIKNVQEEWCDSTAGNQRCLDGTLCSLEFLDCTTPRHCSCTSKKAEPRTLDEFCDSTVGNQRCKDGTTCDAAHLDCPTPQKCACGSRPRALQASISPMGGEFCDSTLKSQRCRDGTPCDPSRLDCTNPQKCICGSSAGSDRVMSLPSGGLEFCDSLIPNQKCKDGTVCSSQFLDCLPDPHRCLCGSLPNRVLDHEDHGSHKTQANVEAAVELCDSTIGTQTCKDGTPCSRQFLDCTNPMACRCSFKNSLGGGELTQSTPRILGGSVPRKDTAIPQASAGDVEYCDPTLGETCQNGTPCSSQVLECSSPLSCICGSAKAGGVGGTRVVRSSSVTSQPDIDEIQHNQWSDWISVRKDPSQDIKPKVEYCDSTLHQRCKDGTVCSPELLDCITKGPKRCICSNKNEIDDSRSRVDAQRRVLPVQTVPGQVGFDLRTLNQAQYTPQSSAGPKYCNSLMSPTERCEDMNRTLCSPLYLDCTTKGPAQCICGSGAAAQSLDTNLDNKGWFGAGLYCLGKSLYYCSANQQCSMADQCVNGCFNSPASLPDYCIPNSQTTSAQPGRNLNAKTAIKYCDSLADPPQRCRDATPCSPQYLDCTTKGPRRCICEADTGSMFGRSLSMPQPAVQAGTGGGLTYVGDTWNGAGLYCNERTSDLLYCNANAECRLAEHCQRGCFASTGVMDYCIKGTDYLGGLVPPRSSPIGN